MNARFRVRLRDGGDLTVGSLEGLFERVASGIVGRHDLIHDALTGEWAPAGTLPVFWLCTDLLAHGVPPGSEAVSSHLDAPARPEGDRRGAVAGGAPGGPPGPVRLDPEETEGPTGFLDLALAEPAAGRSPEEEARAFIARMEEERAEDGDAPSALAELRTWTPQVAPEAGEASGTSRPDPDGRTSAGSSLGRGEARRASGAAAPSPAAAVPEGSVAAVRRPALRRRTRRSQPHLMSVALAVILGTAGIAGGVGLAWPGMDTLEPGGDPGAMQSAVARPVPPTEEELRAGAHADFVEAVADVVAEADLGTVPRVWLEGRYLADAGAFQEVEAYWTRYRDVLEAVRTGEDALYRSAYLDRVEAAGITGPVRSLRLATAMADFSGEGAAREAVYHRVAELVDAALALHELSARAAGRISYEPARANRISADPVIEAAGTDEEMQTALDAALDRVLLAVNGEVEGEGPGRDGLGRWLADALREKGL